MFCPRCGQEQISEKTRFCSRCGFLLELVSEVLVNGGVLPQLLNLNQNKKLLTRKNGLKFSLIWVILMWFIITPIFLFSDADELFLISGALGFGGGLLGILISFLFLNNNPTFSNFEPAKFQGGTAASAPPNFGVNPVQGALPPQSIPVSAYTPPPPAATAKWNETRDLVKPPSVTEETTKLLQKDE